MSVKHTRVLACTPECLASVWRRFDTQACPLSVSDFERQEPGVFLVFLTVHESRLPAGRQGHGHVISYGLDKI